MSPHVPVDPEVFGRLLAEVVRILREWADPEIAQSFDAARWLTTWLNTPHPAL